MIRKIAKLTADAERRAYAKNQAVAILHTLINHLHVDGAYYVDKPRIQHHGCRMTNRF